MDALTVVLNCMFDIIKLVVLVAILFGVWYHGYSSGWLDCNKTRRRVRKEMTKILKMY